MLKRIIRSYIAKCGWKGRPVSDCLAGPGSYVDDWEWSMLSVEGCLLLVNVTLL